MTNQLEFTTTGSNNGQLSLAPLFSSSNGMMNQLELTTSNNGQLSPAFDLTSLPPETNIEPRDESAPMNVDQDGFEAGYELETDDEHDQPIESIPMDVDQTDLPDESESDTEEEFSFRYLQPSYHIATQKIAIDVTHINVPAKRYKEDLDALTLITKDKMEPKPKPKPKVTLEERNQEGTGKLCIGLDNGKLIKLAQEMWGKIIHKGGKVKGVYNLEKQNYYSWSCKGSQTVNTRVSRCSGCYEMEKTVDKMLQRCQSSKKTIEISVPQLYQSVILATERKFNEEREQKKLVERENEELKREMKKLTNQNVMLRMKVQELVAFKEKVDPIYSLLEEVFHQYPDFTESFLYIFVKAQLECITRKPRGMRWPKELINFCATIRYLGGTSTLEYMRGAQFEGQGKMDGKQQGILLRDLRKTALLMVPSSTLKNTLPPIEPYKDTTAERIAKFVAMLEHMLGHKLTEEDLVFVGLIADEIEIKHGLVYNSRKQQLYGLDNKPITAEDLKDYFHEGKLTDVGKKTIESKLARKMLMVFLVSADGKISLPLACKPTATTTVSWYQSVFKNTVTELEKYHIRTIFGSTDGWDTSLQFAEKMKLDFKYYNHIFDYVHLIKNGRNYTMKKAICRGPGPEAEGPNGAPFSMRTLIRLWEKNETIRKFISFDDLHPTDKMALKPVVKLFNPRLIEELRSEKYQEDYSVQELALYLEHLRNWYECWNNNKKLSKLPILKEASDYFETLRGGVSKIFRKQVKHSYDSLVAIEQYVPRSSNGALKIAHLGTNLVENFFSIVRRKVLYPNLFDFYCIEQRAFTELIKKFAVDAPFQCKGTTIGNSECYGNMENASFRMEDIPQLPITRSSENRKRKLETIKPSTPNTIVSPSATAIALMPTPNPAPFDVIGCMKQLAEEFRPSRRLTIRQATCKANPTAAKVNSSYILCELEDCVKTYVYRGSYANHLEKAHLKVDQSIKNHLLDEATNLGEKKVEQDANIAEAESIEKMLSNQGLFEDFMNEQQSSDQDIAIVLLHTETVGNAADQEISKFNAVELLSKTEYRMTQEANLPPPTWKEHGPKFLAWLDQFGKQVHLIAHDYKKDKAALESNYKKIGEPFPEYLWHDTVQFLKTLQKKGTCDLQALCKVYHVDPVKEGDTEVEALTLLKIILAVQKKKQPNQSLALSVTQFCETGNVEAAIKSSRHIWTLEEQRKLEQMVAENKKPGDIEKELGIEWEKCRTKLQRTKHQKK
jgi:hypothetical protein